MASNQCGIFKCSERSLSLREFLDEHESQLPKLLVVRGGLCGVDDLHSFANDEIFRIDNVDVQQRLVFSDDRGKKLSLPSNHHLKFQKVDSKGKAGKSKNLMEIIGETKKLNKLKIQVEQNSQAEFIFGNDSRRTSALGTLKYEDMYDEKYLIGFSVIEGKLSIKPVVIPVYVGIYIAAVTAFARPSSLSMADYLKTMSPTMSANLKERKLNEKIFILPDDKHVESEYAYISPSAILNFRIPDGDGTYQGLSEEVHEDPIYEEISRMIKPKPKPSVKKPAVPIKPQISVKTKKDNTYAAVDEKSMKNDPSKEVIKSLKSLNVDSKGKKNTESSLYEDVDEHNDKSANKKTTISRELPKPPTKSSTVELPKTSVTYESVEVAENPYGSLPIYESLSEVPLDVSKLSKYRIADCLRLLNLDKYSNRFIKESVDGGLIVSLDESILQEEFKFTNFESKKLMRFVNGWRPVEED